MIGKYFNFDKKDHFKNLNKNTIELDNYKELKKIFNWKNDPNLDTPIIYQFDYIEDVNERRIRDAESIGTVMCNINPMIALEIGTALGYTTALMALNSPNASIYTINIPPEEIYSGEGGDLTTIALDKEEIGSYYRERGLKNIVQIYENSAKWEPNIGNIDIAFIDGCHDTNFVYNDTKKVLLNMKPGSFVLWHDFNLNLMNKYNWIYSICQGIEKLYKDNLIKGRIFQIKDSWVGIYKID